MGEVRVTYEDEWLDELQRLYPRKPPRAGAVIREAIILYKWAIEQRAKGRYIVSMEPDMTDPARLLMPSIEELAPPETPGARSAESPVTKPMAATTA